MINVLWFKRDLRLTDHDPLAWLCQQDVPVRLIYIFEPSLIADQHYSLRHWRFVYQSLQDMQCQLAEKMAVSPVGARQGIPRSRLGCLRALQLPCGAGPGKKQRGT